MTILELLPTTERETLKFRLLVLLVVSAMVLFRVRGIPVLAVVGLVAAYLAYSVALRLVLLPRFRSYWLLGTMLAVDAATLLTAIYLVGLNTPVVMLLPIGVVYYGLYFGYAGGLLMAVTVSFGFVAMVYLSGRLTEMANIIAIQVPSSFLLAILVGYLAQARLHETEERRSFQQLLQTESQGRRLLELASSMETGAWDGLGPPELAELAAAIAGRPWAAVLLADKESSSLVLAGTTYEPASTAPAPLGDYPFSPEVWSDGVEVDEALPPDAAIPRWAPAMGRPGYLWATTVGDPVEGILCVMGPDGADLDEERKEGLRTFAPLAGRILRLRRLFLQLERRGRDLVGELRSTVATSSRLTQVQSRRPLQFGQLLIEPSRDRVRLGIGIVHLTRIEFDLLYMLASNAGDVFNGETLLHTIWSPDYSPQGKPVDVAIHRLRKKLDAFESGSRMIRTVRGRGYTFVQAEASVLTPEAGASAGKRPPSAAGKRRASAPGRRRASV